MRTKNTGKMEEGDPCNNAVIGDCEKIGGIKFGHRKMLRNLKLDDDDDDDDDKNNTQILDNTFIFNNLMNLVFKLS